MAVDLPGLIFQPETIAPVIAGAGALVAGALSASLLVPPIARRLLPMPRETRLADYLPFTTVLQDGMTIGTQRGDLCRVLAIEGAELMVATRREHEALFTARRTWLTQIAERRTRVRVFSVRSPIVPAQMLPHPHPILRDFAEAWESSFADSAFVTRHYVVLSVEAGSHAPVLLDEVTQLTLSALDPFRPRVLDSTTAESPLAILARLASPISQPHPRVLPGAPVAEQITADAIVFPDDHRGTIVFHGATEQRLVAIIGIKTFGDSTEEAMIAQIASLPFPLIIHQHIEPMSRLKATAALDLSYRLARTTILREDGMRQFDDVRSLIDGTAEQAQALCDYALMILIEAPDEATLNKRIAAINTIAAQHQVTTVRETTALQPAWWSMWPTYDRLPRPWKLLAANVATLLAFQTNRIGAMSCPWGDAPVTVLRTATGNPYHFVFHDQSDPGNSEPLGHMLVVGPSGSGKTVIVSWLATMAMRYPDLRVFFFDRYFGTEVITNIAGGAYVTFDGRDAAQMNPLQMELTPRNRDFLLTWFKLITGLVDERSSEQFGRAIDMLAHLPRDQRNLKELWKPGFPADSEARAKLMPWIADNQYGSIFCAPVDTLDLEGRLVSFDFTRILDPERLDNLGPAVVSYIIHRSMDVSIEQGYPALYFVDETAPLLANPFFAAKFAAGLQEGRKLNTVYICAFQRPNAIEQSGMAQTILGQCATQIFFRNVKAREEDFAIFGFSEREMDFVLGRSHRHIRRAFLLRRMSEAASQTESVIIDADLSPIRRAAIGDGLAAYASGTTSVRLLRELRQRSPETFRTDYLRHAQLHGAAA